MDKTYAIFDTDACKLGTSWLAGQYRVDTTNPCFFFYFNWHKFSF
jgi:hypothetical protein